jgi:hypothetical protein
MVANLPLNEFQKGAQFILTSIRQTYKQRSSLRKLFKESEDHLRVVGLKSFAEAQFVLKLLQTLLIRLQFCAALLYGCLKVLRIRCDRVLPTVEVLVIFAGRHELRLELGE